MGMAKPWEKMFIASLKLHPLTEGYPDSSRVRRWRARLIRKGFVVEKHGSFDASLRNATVVAQIAAGTDPDGIVGPSTWDAVGKMKKQRRPLVPAVLWRPKIIDSRPGKNGYPKHAWKKWGTRKRADIMCKVWHFTGNAIPFLADAKFHVFSDYLDQGGAPALAYTIGVPKNGTIEVFNNWQDITWSCRWNTPSLNIAFQGGEEGPNALQKRAIRWVKGELENGTFKPFKDEPAWPMMPRSDTTHMHVTATACPGTRGEAFYRSISRQFFTNPRSLV